MLNDSVPVAPAAVFEAFGAAPVQAAVPANDGLSAFPSAAVTPPTGNVGFANFGAAPTQAAVPESANGNFASFGAAPAAPSPTRRRRNLRSPRFRKVLWFSKQCTSMV